VEPDGYQSFGHGGGHRWRPRVDPIACRPTLNGEEVLGQTDTACSSTPGSKGL